MLLLRDFLRLAAIVLATSTVAFSLSFVFPDGDRALTDLRGLRVAGNVASLWDDIFPQCWCAFAYKLPLLPLQESKEARHVNQTNKPPAKSQSGRDKRQDQGLGPGVGLLPTEGHLFTQSAIFIGWPCQ